MNNKVKDRTSELLLKKVLKSGVSSEPLDFGRAIKLSKEVLIFMSVNEDDFNSCLDFCRYFQKNFPEKRISIILNGLNKDPLKGFKPANVFLFLRNDFNYLNFFKKSFLKNINNIGFDLYIDLNPGFEIPAVYLSSKMDCPVKATLYSKEKEKFFNFYLRGDQRRSIKDRYISLINCFLMLSKSEY